MIQLGSRDTQNSQDSAFSSHIMSSQLPSSQCSDFSQIASQDMFSQNNSGPQADVFSNNSQPGMKRMSMYEKWLSKRSLFRHDPPNSGPVDNKISFPVATGQTHPPDNTKHCGYGTSDSSNSLTRPLIDSSLKGSERDLLRQVTYAIHDCSSEMKSALCAVKDKLDNVTEMTNDQLAQTLTSFLGDIWKHQEKLQHLFQDQDKSKSVVNELEVKLAKKESQIAALEEQLLQARKDRTPRFAKAVRCEMQSPQLLLQRKLEEILEWTKDTKEQQNQHLNEYLQSMEAHFKRHLNKGQSQEAEKRMLAELRKVPDKLECKQREFHSQLTDDIKNCLLAYKGDFEDMMKHFIRQYCSQLIYGPEESTSLPRSGILNLFKSQVEAVSCKLGDVMMNHFIQNTQHLTQLQDTLSDSMQHIKDMVQTHSLEHGSIAYIGHRLDSFQSSLKQHLISIQNKHSGEIKELRNQLYKQLKYPAENMVLEHNQSLSAVKPSVMKEISPNFSHPDKSAVTTGNSSLVAAACSHVNATMLKLSRNAPENTITRDCVMDKNSLDTSSQIYQQSSRNCQMNLSAFTNSNVQAYSSVSQGHKPKSPRHSAPTAAAPENLHAACCHPFSQCEVSFTLKSGPSPVVAVVSQNPDNCHNKKHVKPKQSVIRMKVGPPDLKKQADRKRDASMKKKSTSNKYVENVTVMKTPAEQVLPTGRWTRSRYKCFQQIQTLPQSDQPVCQLVGSDRKFGGVQSDQPVCQLVGSGRKFGGVQSDQPVCQLVGSDRKFGGVQSDQPVCQLVGSDRKFGGVQRSSWPSKQDKTTKQCSDTRDPSVYDFHENETCELPAIPRNRKRTSTDSLESMSLASFINNWSVQKRKDSALEKNSECSSPTVSITKMSIVRKVRTPFRRPYRIDALNKPSFDTDKSPAPTLLSDISCQM